MITIYSKLELQDFIMTHEMLNSDYTPPLERKGHVWLIFEKGDIIIFNNKKYLYLGRIHPNFVFPRDLDCFYKQGPAIRCRTTTNGQSQINRYYQIYRFMRIRKAKERNKYLSSETRRIIESDSRKLQMENNKYNRELRIRQKGIELLGGRCKICGTTKNLSFVHRSPADKVASVSRLIKENRALDVIYNEMLKCDLMCQDCREDYFRQLYHKKKKYGD